MATKKKTMDKVKVHVFTLNGSAELVSGLRSMTQQLQALNTLENGHRGTMGEVVHHALKEHLSVKKTLMAEAA